MCFTTPLKGKMRRPALSDNVTNFSNELDNMLRLFERKDRDYGPGNLSVMGLPGVVVRISDKTARLVNIVNSGQHAVKEETVVDTLRDLANYAIIAVLMAQGKWPVAQLDSNTQKDKNLKVLIGLLDSLSEDEILTMLKARIESDDGDVI
jgi:hypothetical protein